MEETSVDNEPVATLSEYMEDIEARELEADLVLGGDEGKECTYGNGYMKRQAVFACITCTPGGNAGFCTACSLACHDGHEVVELWTRRLFRCDCGNSKFGGAICKLCGDKEPENRGNTYNQNYRGLYCVCHRPYPDPDGVDQGEMLQCCICEDWFHECHLGLPLSLQAPRDEEGEPTFDELVCQACVSQCSFISRYPELLIAPMPAEAEEAPEKVITTGGDERENNGASVALEMASQDKNIATAAKPESSGGGVVVCKLGRGADLAAKTQDMIFGTCSSDSAHANGDSCSGSSCKGKLAVDGLSIEPGQAVFLAKDWRSQLCRCIACLKLYEAKGVGYVLDQEDTLQEYEATAKRKREEALVRAEGAGQQFMQKMGHVQRIELLHGLNDMTTQLKSFLAPFGQSGKTVTSSDIQEFFDKLTHKRRRQF